MSVHNINEFKKYITRFLHIEILDYFCLYDLVTNLCLVDKYWYNIVFTTKYFWKEVTIARKSSYYYEYTTVSNIH